MIFADSWLSAFSNEAAEVLSLPNGQKDTMMSRGHRVEKNIVACEAVNVALIDICVQVHVACCKP